MEREESCKLSGAASRPLRLEVPKRAIDRVAGSAGGKKWAEVRPVCPGGNWGGGRLDRQNPVFGGSAKNAGGAGFPHARGPSGRSPGHPPPPPRASSPAKW